MTSPKRPPYGLAFALVVALLAVLAPAALADPPDEIADRKVAKEAEKDERRPANEAEKVAAGAEPEEEAERADKPEKADDQPVPSTEPCAGAVFARVFKPWRDRRLYTLAPGGDFEALAEGWTLEGATLAADSSPFLLGAALGASSLELPAGATAVSAPICVRRGMPSFRFFAWSVGGEQAVVKVQILYPSGKLIGRGRLRPGTEWAPTKRLSLSQGQFKVKRRAATQIRLRFAVTAGTARLDDVYIDPRMWR